MSIYLKGLSSRHAIGVLGLIEMSRAQRHSVDIIGTRVEENAIVSLVEVILNDSGKKEFLATTSDSSEFKEITAIEENVS